VTLIGKQETYTNSTFDYQIIKIWHAYFGSYFERVFFNTRSKIKTRRVAAAPPRRRGAIGARSWPRETKPLRHINRIRFSFAAHGGRGIDRLRNEGRRDFNR